MKALLETIHPKVDFLPGCELAGNQRALEAVTEAVRQRVAMMYGAGARTEWHGTHVVVIAEDGLVLARGEVHGATYDREHNIAGGVRVTFQ